MNSGARGSILGNFEKRFRALYERSQLAVYVHDFEGRFLDANDSALKLLGFSRDELLAINFATLLDESQLPLAMATALELLETGAQKRLTEFKLRRKDGTWIWVETAATTLYDGEKPVAAQGMAYDITERKRTEQQLRQGEERYRLVVDHVKEVIWTMDLDLRFT